MTSTVTDYISGLDLEYPVAGVDNDTQGFRDAFTKINQAFTATSNEITALQLQINDAITTGTAFAESIATTVTNLVLSNITATIATTVTSVVTQILSTSTTRYAIAAPTTSKGGFGDTKGAVFANSTTIYVCYADWVAPGTADIWAKVDATTSPW